MGWAERLSGYLAEKMPHAQEVVIVRAGGMPAGASNETLSIDLRVVCDGLSFELPLVLRPQRSDGILAPYDVERQYRVIRALSRSAVPVPAVAWFERDLEVLGAPFFLMHRLKAETLPLFWYGGQSPRLTAAAEALATIHAVDWRAAGLSFLLPGGEGETFRSPIECEIDAWTVKAQRMGAARLELAPALERYLRANEPADARHTLVHGDPNPGNYLFRGNEVVAVVDWELAAIGDPRSDLGFYAALAAIFGGAYGAEPGRSVLSEAYEAVTGQALANMAYYEAFGLYRMLVVMAGWGGGGFGFYGADTISRRLAELLGPRWGV